MKEDSEVHQYKIYKKSLKSEMDKKGSMTIELACIMPFILAIMVLLIYVTGYLYNRQTIEKIACISVEKGLMMEHANSSLIKKELDQYIGKQIMERLIFKPDTTYHVQVSMLSVEVDITMTQQMPIKGLTELLPIGLIWKSEAKQKATRLNPAEILWMKG